MLTNFANFVLNKVHYEGRQCATVVPFQDDCGSMCCRVIFEIFRKAEKQSRFGVT